jgi:hypothetical protein
MSWVKQWQEYIYFDLILGASDKVSDEVRMPEAINWDSIAKP